MPPGAKLLEFAKKYNPQDTITPATTLYNMSNKISINALLRTSADLKIISAPAGTGVYSGLYLIGNEQSLCKISEILLNEEFSIYISSLGKYKSGGYYTFSSKDIKAYLDYKLAYDGGLLQWWQMKNF